MKDWLKFKQNGDRFKQYNNELNLKILRNVVYKICNSRNSRINYLKWTILFRSQDIRKNREKKTQVLIRRKSV